jgi:hypothetical protein
VKIVYRKDTSESLTYGFVKFERNELDWSGAETVGAISVLQIEQEEE